MMLILIILGSYFSLGAVFSTWMLLPAIRAKSGFGGILIAWLLHTCGWLAMLAGMLWMARLDVRLKHQWENFDA